MADEAVTEQGNLGPDGSNLFGIWSRSDRCFLVAEFRGRVIGCCGVKRGTDSQGTAEESCPVCSVWKVSVDASMRRSGVGQLLMEAAEAWALDAGATEMNLCTGNPAARDFYCKRMGYAKLGNSAEPTPSLPRIVSSVHSAWLSKMLSEA